VQLNLKYLRDQSIDRIKTKTDFSSYYLEQGGWDLFMTVFADPHDVGHQCWHLHDPGHPKHDPDWVRQFGNPIQDLYVAIDAAIGKLVEQAGPQATVMVFTGPGMGPNYTANFLLDGILRRLEGPPNRGSVTTMGTLKSAYRKNSAQIPPHPDQIPRQEHGSRQVFCLTEVGGNTSACRITKIAAQFG
jgi:Uncharacterized conserved protein